MQTYTHASLPQAAALLKKDKYTFSVLSRILQGTCELIMTDHERLVICYSQSPFPVWIWMPEDASEAEMERAWQILCAEFPYGAGFRYCARSDFAQYVMRRAEAQGETLAVEKNLLAYHCPELVPPGRRAEGCLCTASMDELKLATAWEGEMRRECGAEILPDDSIRAELTELIEKKQLFIWKNGGCTAMCYVRINGNVATFSCVYTRPQARRRGYAASMIYEVSMALRRQGLMPALYTDADYAASNACYMQVGFQPKGSLCILVKRA